jgi:hypothetical protein
MENIKQVYEYLLSVPCDINEHLPTLCRYAEECDSVFETGVRGSISSWVLTYGLLLNNKNETQKTLLLNDITECDVKYLLDTASSENIKIDCIWKNNLEIEINRNYDLTFIDTWHVYGQLKRELEKFSKITKKYIIMHDTTVDEWEGETIRNGWNAVQQSLDSGFPLEEITTGLWPAIEEFLKNNPNWILHERFTNNNGLTILKRNSAHPINFSIPENKITNLDIVVKEKILSNSMPNLIPGDFTRYIYNTEEEYYNEYRKSLFAVTTKKTGWDCLRHYEIIANCCIPYFPDIEVCPKNTMIFLPKNLIKEGNILYNKCSEYKTIIEIPKSTLDECSNLIKQLLQHFKSYLTTRKVAEYVLEKSNNTKAKSVLYLSGDTSPDYLRCLTLHGFKEILGASCHDYPKIPHIYTSENINYGTLYGKGITYTNLLDDSLHFDELDKTILDDIARHKYDIVIYGSYTRGMPYYELVCSSYKPNEIILFCGDDLHNCNYNNYVEKGHLVFVREL